MAKRARNSNPKHLDPEPGHSPVRRILLWALAAVFAVKVVALVQLGNHPLLQPHGELDSAYYVELARQVAHRGPMAVAEPFFVSPLYVFFLALVFKLSGDSLMAARTIQILLGTAAVAFVYLTARRWFSERVAGIAAALCALTGTITFSEVLLLQASLDPFLVSCTLYFIARTQADDRRWPLAAAGFSMGLFALNRPNALVYGLAASVLIGYASWRSGAGRRAGSARTAITRAVIYLACLFLVLVPNALRNYAVSGEPILISSHGGLNFFMGNHAGADGTYQRIAGITPSIAGQARDSQRAAEEAAGHSMSPGEVSRYFYLLAWDWIADQPAEAFKLLLRKLAILINRTGVALNYSYAYYREESVLLRLLFVGPWLLMPLGLVGLGLRARRPGRPGFWVWGSFIPIYGVSVAAFFVSDRYRLPLLVPLCITSAAAVEWLITWLRHRPSRHALAPALAIALAFTATFWNLGLNDGKDDEKITKAVWLVEQGAYREAQDYVASVAAAHSHPGLLRFQVGMALATAGREEDAIREFGAALELDPGENAIHLALGQALARARRPAEALPHLVKSFDEGYEPSVSGPLLIWALSSAGRVQEAVRRLEEFPDTMANRPETAIEFGTIAFEGRDPVLAERWMRIAVAQAPEEPEAQLKLGLALLLQNRVQEAVVPLETAARLSPKDAAVYRNLAFAYAGCNRFAEARAAAEEALRLDPDQPQVRDFLRSLPKK